MPEHTVERGWINYRLWQDDPLLDNLRSEEGLQRLMQQVRHKWEGFVRFDPTSA